MFEVMDGNTLTRSCRALYQIVASPRDGIRWVANRLDRRSAIDMRVPWMSWKAIDYLRAHLPPRASVFEWGGGGSSLFFLLRGCTVTTAESSLLWKKRLERAVADNECSGNLVIRLIPAETGTPEHISEYVRSVRQGAPWNVVVVDGLENDDVSRVECVREARGTVKPGGVLILDDAWRREYRCVPEILNGWQRKVFVGLGPERLGVTRTDIFTEPRETG